MKLCMGCMNQVEDHITSCPYCGFNEATYTQESYYLNPGTIMGGKYIIGKVLNYGGHTISYMGFDAEKNEKVVIKEYLPSDFSTRSEGEKEITIYSGDAMTQFENGLTNFLNEANRIQQLGNPEGIAKVYDCIAENDTGYVVSEYLKGQTLKEILDAGKKYSVEEAKQFIETILRGLSKVHPMDIIHCDIAPETIMVTDTGEIKLLDFGATRYVTTANSKSLAIILKQGYAPEEQYRSRGQRGPWTDVYAVAAVMYRMITGVVPQESVERALLDELKEPSKMGVSIPVNIENALMNAINVYKDERTPSAEKFLQELTSPTVKRLKVKKRKHETGKFPVWAKILVAGLLIVVVAGGVLLFKLSDTGNGNLTNEDIILASMETQSLEDAEKYIAQLNKEYKWELSIEPSYVYTSDESLSGSIAGQEGIPDSLNLSELVKNSAEGTENINTYGLTIDGNSISGDITYIVYRSDAAYYSELRGMNAYTLAEKIGLDTTDANVFVADKETVGGNYFDLKQIVKTDGTIITAEDLKAQGQERQEIAISDIRQVEYYASEFFYWESLDNFVGETVDTLPEYAVYELVNEKDMEQRGEKTLAETSLIDQEYYTFDNIHYKKGYIFEQTVPSGSRLDMHTDMGMLQNGILLRAIKEVIPTNLTGFALRDKVAWKNTVINWSGSKDGSQPVLGVTVVNNDTGEEVAVFKNTDNLTITIKTKEKPVVKKKKKTVEKDDKDDKAEAAGSLSNQTSVQAGNAGRK
ncbi:MAG: protein kinase [Lachnospiraceae bacterium]|nr:protein kinase [Lachnospiraceae bacterium]